MKDKVKALSIYSNRVIYHRIHANIFQAGNFSHILKTAELKVQLEGAAGQLSQASSAKLAQPRFAIVGVI